jgi:hypothetical protein
MKANLQWYADFKIDLSWYKLIEQYQARRRSHKLDHIIQSIMKYTAKSRYNRKYKQYECIESQDLK